MDKLGMLERVELRSVWKTEDRDFTPWLAGEDNIALLGKTLGLDLEVEAQEKEVGPFRADILCKDTASGEWVLIENQLERTDHVHLGQLMTYAAGLDAVTIIWVAARFNEEHRAALDWLNNITDDTFNFFGLEVELWKIGESRVAPKFNIVSKPNDWSRSVRRSAKAVAGLSETGRLQLAFWTQFREFMEENSFIRVPKPAPQSWMYHTLGRGGFVLNSIMSTWDSVTQKAGGEVRAEFVFEHQEAKAYYALVEARKAEIDSAVGEPLTWYNPDNARLCRIYMRKVCDVRDEADWPNQHAWLKEKLEKLHGVFAPLVKELTLE